MSDVRKHDSQGDALEDNIVRDLRALHARSSQDIPPLAKTLNASLGGSPGSPWKERTMPRFFNARPRFALVGVAAAVILALLLIPISYEKTVGHEVTLAVSGLDTGAARGIAKELGTALGGVPVGVEVRSDGGAVVTTLHATTRGSSPEAVSEAFASALEAKGYEVTNEVTPVREKVSGNLYAMARDNVIRVSVDGKTAEELETEIAAALAAAGVPNAEVSVSMSDGNMNIEVRAESDNPGEIPPTGQVVLTSGGQELEGEIRSENVIVKRSTDESGEHLIVEVEREGTTAVATVDNPGALSEQALAAEIHRQLAEQGLGDVSVSVQGKQVRVLSMDGAAPAPKDRETSWGKLKSDSNR